MKPERSIFISYRRTNSAHARLLFHVLQDRGYDCFLDHQSLDSGHFPTAIIAQIKARAHFVVILTPSALQRCVDPNDWVRREIETAIKFERNIVPLIFDGFDFGAAQAYMAGDMLPNLGEYNGVPVFWEYFEAAIKRLDERFLSKPVAVTLYALDAPVVINADIDAEKSLQAAEEPDEPVEMPVTGAGTPRHAQPQSKSAGGLLQSIASWLAGLFGSRFTAPAEQMPDTQKRQRDTAEPMPPPAQQPASKPAPGYAAPSPAAPPQQDADELEEESTLPEPAPTITFGDVDAADDLREGQPHPPLPTKEELAAEAAYERALLDT